MSCSPHFRDSMNTDGKWIKVEFINYAIDVFIEKRDLPNYPENDWKATQMMAKELLGIETYPRDYIKFIPKADPGDIEAGRFGSAEPTPTIDLLEKSDKIALKAHDGQKHGEDEYIVHPRRVAIILMEEFGYLFNAKEKVIVGCAGKMHDVIEDSDLTFRDLNREFGYNIAKVVYAVTNENGMAPFHRIKKSKKATAVKLADRIDNLRSCFPLDDKTKRFANKYSRKHERFYYELSETSRWGVKSKLRPMWNEYLGLIAKVEEHLKED